MAPRSRPTSQKFALNDLGNLTIHLDNSTPDVEGTSLQSSRHSSVGSDRPHSGRLAADDVVMQTIRKATRNTLVLAHKDAVKEDLRILDVIRETASSGSLLSLISKDDLAGIASTDQTLSSMLHHHGKKEIDLVVDSSGNISHASLPMLVRYLVTPATPARYSFGKPVLAAQWTLKGRPLESKELVSRVVPAARVLEWEALFTFKPEFIMHVRSAYHSEVRADGLVAKETTDGHVCLFTGGSGESAVAQTMLTRLGLVGLAASTRLINAMLLVLHWLRAGEGRAVLADNPEAAQLVLQMGEDAGSSDSESAQALAKVLVREARNYFSPTDFFGFTTACDTDADRLRRMMCCVQSIKLPHWFFKSVKPLESFRPKVVAAQLTLMMYDLIYRFITRGMLHARTRDQAAPIQDLVRVFKVLSFFPLCLILAENLDVSKRLLVLHFWVHVTHHMRELGNMHGFFGLMGGLTQPMLRFLWDFSGAKSEDHKLFEELKRAFSPHNDYRVYRADLSKLAGTSCIPFMGVTNKRLTFLEATADERLVDFVGVKAYSQAMDEFLQGQLHPYSCVKGETYFCFSGPPGPSPFSLSPSGEVLYAPQCRYPPANTRTVFGPNGETAARSLSGCVELDNEPELRLLLAFRMSQTLAEDGVKQLADLAKAESELIVVDKLAETGFLY